jgi:hypothetical protein
MMPQGLTFPCDALLFAFRRRSFDLLVMEFAAHLLTPSGL